jgi:hypothetical protein
MHKTKNLETNDEVIEIAISGKHSVVVVVKNSSFRNQMEPAISVMYFFPAILNSCYYQHLPYHWLFRFGPVLVVLHALIAH